MTDAGPFDRAAVLELDRQAVIVTRLAVRLASRLPADRAADLYRAVGVINGAAQELANRVS